MLRAVALPTAGDPVTTFDERAESDDAWHDRPIGRLTHGLETEAVLVPAEISLNEVQAGARVKVTMDKRGGQHWVAGIDLDRS